MATENHFMLYASNGILAAKLLPDKEFSLSKTKGSEPIAPFIERLEKWLDMRYKTGFSEFLSNVYDLVDIMGLANVYDFIEEPRIRKKAEMVMDVLFMDLAFNHWRGGFCAASGRVYFDSKKTFFNHRSLTVFYQWLGLRAKTNALYRNRTGAFFAVTGYTPLNVLRN